MEGWLLELVKQGGLAGGLVAALYLLVKSYQNQIESEKRRSEERVAAEKQRADERVALEKKATEEIRVMWDQTRTALENNTRLVAALMERFQIEEGAPRTKKRTVVKVDHHDQNNVSHSQNGGGE